MVSINTSIIRLTCAESNINITYTVIYTQVVRRKQRWMDSLWSLICQSEPNAFLPDLAGAEASRPSWPIICSVVGSLQPASSFRLVQAAIVWKVSSGSTLLRSWTGWRTWSEVNSAAPCVWNKPSTILKDNIYWTPLYTEIEQTLCSPGQQVTLETLFFVQGAWSQF
jgi:hypothetical protein